MNLYEVKDNLFNANQDYYLVHCISADIKMGAGIALQFNQLFDMKNKLSHKYGTFLPTWAKRHGFCVIEDRVCNLVTKEKYYEKPTYATLINALNHLKFLIPNDAKLAMPKLGCGLDKLQWEKVKEILIETFNDTDIEIVVYAI